MRDADATQWAWTLVVPIRGKENPLCEARLDPECRLLSMREAPSTVGPVVDTGQASTASCYRSLRPRRCVGGWPFPRAMLASES